MMSAFKSALRECAHLSRGNKICEHKSFKAYLQKILYANTKLFLPTLELSSSFSIFVLLLSTLFVFDLLNTATQHHSHIFFYLFNANDGNETDWLCVFTSKKKYDCTYSEGKLTIKKWDKRINCHLPVMSNHARDESSTWTWLCLMYCRQMSWYSESASFYTISILLQVICLKKIYAVIT